MMVAVRRAVARERGRAKGDFGAEEAFERDGAHMARQPLTCHPARPPPTVFYHAIISVQPRPGRRSQTPAGRHRDAAGDGT